MLGLTFLQSPKKHPVRPIQKHLQPIMSTNDAEIRRAVNKRIIEAGSDTISAIVNAAKASQRKRAENRAEREVADANKEVAEATKGVGSEKKNSPVSIPLTSGKREETYDKLTKSQKKKSPVSVPLTSGKREEADKIIEEEQMDPMVDHIIHSVYKREGRMIKGRVLRLSNWVVRI